MENHDQDRTIKSRTVTKQLLSVDDIYNQLEKGVLISKDSFKVNNYSPGKVDHEREV